MQSWSLPVKAAEGSIAQRDSLFFEIAVIDNSVLSVTVDLNSQRDTVSVWLFKSTDS